MLMLAASSHVRVITVYLLHSQAARYFEPFATQQHNCLLTVILITANMSDTPAAAVPAAKPAKKKVSKPKKAKSPKKAAKPKKAKSPKKESC